MKIVQMFVSPKSHLCATLSPQLLIFSKFPCQQEPNIVLPVVIVLTVVTVVTLVTVITAMTVTLYSSASSYSSYSIAHSDSSYSIDSSKILKVVTVTIFFGKW